MSPFWSLIVSLEVVSCQFSDLVLFLQYNIGYSESFALSYKL